MEMTFNDYIQNPMGRENAVFSHRAMYRELYRQKLDTILVRENGVIKYTLYTTKDDKYLIHMKVPSEVVPNFYYDVVVEFYTKDNTVKVSRSLDNYKIKVFSNDPSFVYTFAHAFIKNKLFIKDLMSKMPKEAINKAAKEKNPTNQVGYVKSLYFAYLIMKRDRLFDKIQYESYGQPYKADNLLPQIEHADIKVQDRKDKAEEIEKQKRLDKKISRSDHNSSNRQQPNNSNIVQNMHRNVRNTKNTRAVGLANMSKRIKSIKKK